MAIKINFYRFSKKENSTAIPSGSGTELDCTLKDSSSIFFPVIKLNLGAASAPSFNYCHISNFDRWYFITNWEWDRGLWYASLQVDVLATYRTKIGSSSLYALRASASYDGSIPDKLYPAKSGCSFVTEGLSGGRPWGNVMQGIFILGIVSQDPDFGSLKYIGLSLTNMRSFIAQLLDDAILTANGFDVQDASLALQKALIDPLQYIKSCVYIPYPPSSLTDSLTTISSFNIWNWTINLAGYEVKYSTPYNTYSGTISIPKHPQTSSRGKFVNQSPFTVLQLQAPPFGIIDLDTTALVDAASLSLGLSLDLPTGLGILTISNDSIVMNRLEAQIGVPVQLSQVFHDYLGAYVGAMGAIGGVISGLGSVVGGAVSGSIGGVAGGLGNMLSSGVSGVGSAIEALFPKAQSIGSGGSYAQLAGAWNIYAQFFTIVDDDLAHNGRPLCQMVTPSSGYYLIQDGDIAIDGTKEEAVELKRYLEGGFYYE